jgi:hypothetical protein
MQPSKSFAVLAALTLWSPPVAAVGDAAGGAAARTRAAFVIGAPGRLDSDADRRMPRRYQRLDGTIAAYVDVEVVDDPTWLRHELEHYARRVVDCTNLAPAWCRRGIRRLGRASAIDLVTGAHGELVWLSGARQAVRLGWRRIVETAGGTMTLDAPPAAFAAEVLAAYPPEPQAFDVGEVVEAPWRADEVDRLLYYAAQVAAALPAVAPEAHRRRAVQFVEDALAQAERLGVLPLSAGLADPGFSSNRMSKVSIHHQGHQDHQVCETP